MRNFHPDYQPTMDYGNGPEAIDPLIWHEQRLANALRPKGPADTEGVAGCVIETPEFLGCVVVEWVNDDDSQNEDYKRGPQYVLGLSGVLHGEFVHYGRNNRLFMNDVDRNRFDGMNGVSAEPNEREKIAEALALALRFVKPS